MFRKIKRGQFFSYDVIAAAAIFLLAFFLVTFYWLNLRSQTQETGDLQRQAVRISDNLMSANTTSAIEWLAKYDECRSAGQCSKKIDEITSIPSIGLLRENSNNRLDEPSFYLLAVLSKDFYADSRQKLGVPLYDYYITIEKEDGSVYNCESVPSGEIVKCEAGVAPGARSAVAGQERVIIFNPNFVGKPEQAPVLARLKVQIWR